jgi:hypothetical protein
LKRNFLGIETSYLLDYFRHAEENKNLDNINNHITAEYAGVSNGSRTMAVAADTTVNACFAFCPFRMRHDPVDDTFSVRANPFGTYHGRQYLPPTTGNRQGFKATRLAGSQFHSAAPTYNGFDQRFSLMIAFNEGSDLSGIQKRELVSFARPPFALSARGMFRSESEIPKKKIEPPAGFLALPHKEKVLFKWENPGKKNLTYRILCGEKRGEYNRVYQTKEEKLLVDDYMDGKGFEPDKPYYARVKAIGKKGVVSSPTREIRFLLSSEKKSQKPEIPLAFQAKVLWHNVNKWVSARLF